MRKQLQIILASMLVLFVAGSSSLANADTVTIVFQDATDSLSLTVNGFPSTVPLFPTVEECSGFAADLPQPAGTTITGGLANFNIFEDASFTTLSDTLSLFEFVDALGHVGAGFVFLSDVEGAPLIPLPNGTSLVENGTVQLASTVTFNNGLSSLAFGFRSEVPEPSSLLLLGTGLMGVIGVTRRRLLGNT